MLSLILEKIKAKTLVAWSISEGRMDQKQILNFLWPQTKFLLEYKN